jgi:cytochrome P450
VDATFHWLANHPEEQDRLHAEITSLSADVLKTTDTEGPAALELALKMPYLDAMIQESYRTFGAPANNLERVVGESGLTLPNGIFLPPGTIAAMNPACMSMLPNVYGHDAHFFRPSRWLQNNGESEEAFRERLWWMRRSLLVVSILSTRTLPLGCLRH